MIAKTQTSILEQQYYNDKNVCVITA